MKIILYVVGCVAVAYAASATFAVHPPPAPPPKQPPAITTVVPGQEPWADSERKVVGLRIYVRNDALRTLGQPWSSFCTDGGRKHLTAVVDRYFGHRAAQTRGFADNWGEAGAQHIARAWAGADDNRIEQLTRQAYRNGYLDPDALSPGARTVVATLLRGDRAAPNPCAS